MSGSVYLSDEELAARIPALHSELERIERELTDSEKQQAIASAFEWARSLDLQPRPSEEKYSAAEAVVAQEPDRIRARASSEGISGFLLVSGVLVADLGAVAVLALQGLSASFAIVIVGLVAATFGVLQPARKNRRD